MKTILLDIINLTPHSGLGLLILVIGAMFTGSVCVSIISFYLDDYWPDEEYRKELRLGRKASKSR